MNAGQRYVAEATMVRVPPRHHRTQQRPHSQIRAETRSRRLLCVPSVSILALGVRARGFSPGQGETMGRSVTIESSHVHFVWGQAGFPHPVHLLREIRSRTFYCRKVECHRDGGKPQEHFAIGRYIATMEMGPSRHQRTKHRPHSQNRASLITISLHPS